ncbi:MAG: phosphate ABC transporter ATP-binding protein [Synechococcales bacterium]|nr:phosphate ABC transporter ATP-binding protein [Synechococcales bacterium]
MTLQFSPITRPLSPPRADIPDPVLLRFDKVSVFYHGIPAIKDISLSIYRHQITSFIGPSGSGKSSLLRCCNRLNDLIPHATVTGHLYLEGSNINSLSDVALRRRVGMVFQRPNPFPKSIYDNIVMGLRVNGFRGNVDERVEQSLQQVGLWHEVKDNLRRSALHLSLGQQQRLCIARAIALGSRVLLMDEPCAALDPISAERINQLLKAMKHEYTIIIVTHNLKQAAMVSDRVAFFNVKSQGGQRAGHLVEEGAVPGIFMQPRYDATRNYLYYQTLVDT